MRMRSQPTKRRESRGCPESPPADTRWIGPAPLKEGAQIRASASPSNSGRCAASYTRSQQRDHMPLASFDEAAIQPTAKVAYQQWIGEREPAQAEQAQQQLLLLRHVHQQPTGQRSPRRIESLCRPPDLIEQILQDLLCGSGIPQDSLGLGKHQSAVSVIKGRKRRLVPLNDAFEQRPIAYQLPSAAFQRHDTSILA